MEKFKTYLKDKGIGFYGSAAAVVFTFIALLVYLITVRESFNPYLKPEDFTLSVVVCLALGCSLGLVFLVVPLILSILGLDRNSILKEVLRVATVITPLIIFGFVVIAFFSSLAPIYGVFIRNATGLQGLEPITYSGIHVSLIFCAIALIVSAVVAGLNMFKRKKNADVAAKTESADGAASESETETKQVKNDAVYAADGESGDKAE